MIIAIIIIGCLLALSIYINIKLIIGFQGVIDDIQKLEEEEAFQRGEDLRPDQIEEAFLEATLVCIVDRGDGPCKIVDISSYEKNGVVGLIFLMPDKQESEMLVLPNCSVYRLTDGRWLWRQGL